VNANDVILRLVEMLLEEKEKNAQNQQKQDEQCNKD